MYSLEYKKQISERMKGANNPNWQNTPSYMAVHLWINRNYPKPDFCEECNISPPFDLANITGIYERDLKNWKYLCRKCHMTIDNRIKRDPKTGRFVS